MAAPISFLAQGSERTLNHFIRRHASTLPPAEASASGREPMVVDSWLSGQLQRLRKARGFSACVCVGVAPGDGMTWSAESVARTLAREHGQDPLSRTLLGSIGSRGVIRISGGVHDGKLPPIEHLVGRVRLLDAAVAHELAPRFFSFASLRSWRLFGIAAAVSTVAYLLGGLFTSSAAGGVLAALPMILAPAIAVVGVIGAILTRRIVNHPQEKAVAKLIERLRDETPETQHAVCNLAHDLAAALRDGPFPRWVIVDDWESLDTVTREAIQTYLLDRRTEEQLQQEEEARTLARERGESVDDGEEERRRPRRSLSTVAEIWVIFEGLDGERFSVAAATHGATVRGGGELAPCGITRIYQSHLTPREREELSLKLERPEAARLTTVGEIAGKKRPLDDKLKKLFREQTRTAGPAHGPGPLELLYLMALANAGEPVWFTREELRSLVMGKPVLGQRDAAERHRVLPHFIGSVPYASRLDDLVDAMIERLEPALTFAGRHGHQFRARDGVLEVLESEAPRLRLPDPSIGHLFWAFALRDLRLKRPYRAYWVRRLARHCAEADPLRIGNGARERIAEQFFPLLGDAAHAALRTSLFEQSLELLEQMSTLVTEARLTGPRVRKRLLDTAMEIYGVTGDTRALAPLLAANGQRAEPAPAADGASAQLLGMGMTTLPLDRARRAALAQALGYNGVRERGAEHPALQLFRVRGAWLALALSLTPHAHGLRLQSAYVRDPGLPRLFDDVHARLAAAEHPDLSDAVVLSLALWTSALRFKVSLVSTRLREGRAAPQNGAESPSQLDGILMRMQENEELVAGFTRLVERVAQATSIAQKMARLATDTVRRSRTSEFVAAALAQDLAASALASVVCAYWSVLQRFDQEQIPSETHARAMQVIGESMEFLEGGFTSPAADGGHLPRNVLDRTDRLLRLVGAVWQHLGLDSPAHALSARRLQLASIARTSEQGDVDERVRDVLGTLAPVLGEPGFEGLMANLVAANAPENAKEMRAPYAARAARLAFSAPFGSELRKDLAFFAMLNTHSLGVAENELWLQVLLDDEAGESYLDWYLARTPPEELDTYFLMCMNMLGSAGDDQLRPRVLATLAARLETVEDAETRALLEDIPIVHQLQDQVNSAQAIDLEEVHTRWSTRRDSWVYPWVLTILISAGDRSERTAVAAVETLGSAPGSEPFSTYFHLAMKLADHKESLNEDQLGRLDRYLRVAVPHWENKEPVETNVSGYRFLARAEGREGGVYSQRRAYWEQKKIERDFSTRFPDFARNGRFFLIFKECVRSMLYWKLPVDSPDLEERLGAGVVHRQAVIEAWAESGAVVPPVFVPRQDPLTVATKFVVLGDYLFGPGVADQEKYDGLRQAFDRVAQLAMPRLYGAMVGLDALPSSISQLLRDYSDRFVSEHLSQADALAGQLV